MGRLLPGRVGRPAGHRVDAPWQRSCGMTGTKPRTPNRRSNHEREQYPQPRAQPQCIGLRVGEARFQRASGVRIDDVQAFRGARNSARSFFAVTATRSGERW